MEPKGLLCEPILSRRVKPPVVDGVVVALGQELDAAVLLLVQLQDSMDDRDVSAFHLPMKKSSAFRGI